MADRVRISTPEIAWDIAPAWQEILAGLKDLSIEAWLRAGQAEIIKHGPHRTVYRVVQGGKSLYVKHYRLSDFRSKLRQMIRAPKAETEFRRAMTVAGLHVPTILPVAVGHGISGDRARESFLITEGLDGAEPVSCFVERLIHDGHVCQQAPLRQELAVKLGEFVAQIHNAGIEHKDLHAANLLICFDRNRQPCIHLVDLLEVRLGQPLNWATSRKNLILFNRWFCLRANRTDRLRFWLAYCRSRDWHQTAGTNAQFLDALGQPHAAGLRVIARKLEHGTWRSNLRFWRNRDRRCLVNNRYYKQLQTRFMAGYAVSDLSVQTVDTLLADPDAPFVQAGVRLLKDSPSSTVAEIPIEVNGVVQPGIYKRFKVTDWKDPWLALARRTAAVRCWVFGHGLRERCLPTARPLLVMHRRRGPFLFNGYLLTLKIPEAIGLHEFVAGLDPLGDDYDRSQLRARIDQLAGLIRALHHRRLSHRDLKAMNLLVTPTETWLIDLVGIAARRKLSRHRRAKNLARLSASFLHEPRISLSDRLRFLRAYLQWGLCGQQGWKWWWRQIALATLKKAARNQQHGRLLA